MIDGVHEPVKQGLDRSRVTHQPSLIKLFGPQIDLDRPIVSVQWAECPIGLKDTVSDADRLSNTGFVHAH